MKESYYGYQFRLDFVHNFGSSVPCYSEQSLHNRTQVVDYWVGKCQLHSKLRRK